MLIWYPDARGSLAYVDPDRIGGWNQDVFNRTNANPIQARVTQLGRRLAVLAISCGAGSSGSVLSEVLGFRVHGSVQEGAKTCDAQVD